MSDTDYKVLRNNFLIHKYGLSDIPMLGYRFIMGNLSK